MNDDCLKLTTYHGERDRVEDRSLADAPTGVYARHELQTSLVIRGAPASERSSTCAPIAS